MDSTGVDGGERRWRFGGRSPTREALRVLAPCGLEGGLAVLKDRRNALKEDIRRGEQGQCRVMMLVVLPMVAGLDPRAGLVKVGRRAMSQIRTSLGLSARMAGA
jgi:hypothetical protein